MGPVYSRLLVRSASCASPSFTRPAPRRRPAGLPDAADRRSGPSAAHAPANAGLALHVIGEHRRPGDEDGVEGLSASRIWSRQALGSRRIAGGLREMFRAQHKVLQNRAARLLCQRDGAGQPSQLATPVPKPEQAVRHRRAWWQAVRFRWRRGPSAHRYSGRPGISHSRSQSSTGMDTNTGPIGGVSAVMKARISASGTSWHGQAPPNISHRAGEIRSGVRHRGTDHKAGSIAPAGLPSPRSGHCSSTR